MAKKKNPETVSDLIPDDKNFNLGNSYGEGLIEKSFSKFGAGRGILVDKNNRIIAGNKSTQKFVEAGNEKIIVVETTGDTLVVTKRTDIDLDTPQGREMALADNMAARKNITMDAELIEAELSIAVCEEWGVTSKEENKKDLSDELNSEFKIEIECQSESEQEQLFNEFQKKGYKCRILTL